MEGNTLQHCGCSHTHAHTRRQLYVETHTHILLRRCSWDSPVWVCWKCFRRVIRPHVVIIMWYWIPLRKFTFCQLQTDQLQLRQSSSCWRTLQKGCWIWVYWFKDVALPLRFCSVGVFVSTGAGANFSWFCTVAANLRPQSQNSLEKLT